ncbi:unnamed protein product, partial [Rotaria magnacalcarata]
MKPFRRFWRSIDAYSQGNRVSFGALKKSPVVTNVLLIYVYAESHPFAQGNLEYFIRTAVGETDPVDYYFILQQINNRTVDESKLPKLPPNAHYIQHENKCYDFGTIGWFLNTYTIGNPHKK